MTGPDRVELGVIVGAHALRGEVRVRFFGDGPANLLSIERVWLAKDRDDPAPREIAVEGGGTGRAGEARLRLAGVSSREGAEALRGSFLLADTADLAPLEADEFYWHELVGCQVTTAEGRSIGRVREIWETGAHDVLVVETPGAEQVLVPTAREIMTTVDLEQRRIVVEDLPGLFDPAE